MVPFMSGISTSTNRKRTSDSFNLATSKERLKMSKDLGKQTPTNISNNSSTFNQSVRDRVMSQGSSYPQQKQQPTPKPHTGPFNVKCLFMENAQSLMKKISDYLRHQNVRFIEQ